MDRFYAMAMDDGTMGFYPRQGTRVKNDFGLTLYVYKSNEAYERDSYWWYVVEERTGLSFGRGHTRKEAINNALTAIETRGIDTIRKGIDLAVQKYGVSPMCKPTYLRGDRNDDDSREYRSVDEQ